MSVLIKGLEMPKDGFVEILIRDDGTVQQTGRSVRIEGTDYYAPYIGEKPVMCEAIPVPPHGDLIDRDALTISTAVPLNGKPYQYVHINNIESAPTIIPAEGEET